MPESILDVSREPQRFSRTTKQQLLQNYVLVLAFGIDEVINEARFLLLRQLAVGPNPATGYEFVVYTDRPDEFAMFAATGLPLRIVHHDPARFRAWRGEIDFVLRVKIEFLRDFCAQHEGNVLFLDADVYPRRDIGPLFEAIGRGDLLMHARESVVDESPWYDDFQRYIARRTIYLDGVPRTIPKNVLMWNSGVLGFSTARRGMLDQVLAMTDAMYPELKAPATEQFAFSYVLPRYGKVYQTQEYLYHYWELAQQDFAKVIARLIERYENRPLAELVAATGHILPEQLAPRPPVTFGEKRYHRLLMRFPALWHAASRLKSGLSPTGPDITRFYSLVDSL
jgi:hypothetical protein